MKGGAQIIHVNMDEAMLDSEPDISPVPAMVDSSRWSGIEAGHATTCSTIGAVKARTWPRAWRRNRITSPSGKRGRCLGGVGWFPAPAGAAQMAAWKTVSTKL